MPGIIYMVQARDSNKKLAFVKVGSTRKSMQERMKSLNNEFNNMYRFKVLYTWKCDDYQEVESKIHKQLHDIRGIKIAKKFGYSRECYEYSCKTLLKKIINIRLR